MSLLTAAIKNSNMSAESNCSTAIESCDDKPLRIRCRSPPPYRPGQQQRPRPITANPSRELAGIPIPGKDSQLRPNLKPGELLPGWTPAPARVHSHKDDITDYYRPGSGGKGWEAFHGRRIADDEKAVGTGEWCPIRLPPVEPVRRKNVRILEDDCPPCSDRIKHEALLWQIKSAALGMRDSVEVSNGCTLKCLKESCGNFPRDVASGVGGVGKRVSHIRWADVDARERDEGEKSRARGTNGMHFGTEEDSGVCVW